MNRRPLAGVYPDLEAAIRKAMAKDAAGRFASMQEFAAELRRIAHNLELSDSLETQAVESVSATRPAANRRRLLIGVAAAVLVVAGVAALSPGLRQRIAAVAGRRAAAENHTTLAVLPFSGGGDAEMSALAGGLAQRLSARPTRLESLRDSLTILAPGELIASKVGDGGQAIQKLGATLVISGTLSRAGSGQRLTLEIRDRRRAQPDTVTVENAAGDIGVLEDRAAEGVARVLAIQADAQVSAAL